MARKKAKRTRALIVAPADEDAGDAPTGTADAPASSGATCRDCGREGLDASDDDIYDHGYPYCRACWRIFEREQKRGNLVVPIAPPPGWTRPPDAPAEHFPPPEWRAENPDTPWSWELVVGGFYGSRNISIIPTTPHAWKRRSPESTASPAFSTPIPPMGPKTRAVPRGRTTVRAGLQNRADQPHAKAARRHRHRPGGPRGRS